METTNSILVINGGSSSIKFALYELDDQLERLMHGQLESIGTGTAKLNFYTTTQKGTLPVNAPDYETGAYALIDWLEQQEEFDSVMAVGHRIVHGMRHTEPELISIDLLEELKGFCEYAPEHLPGEIKLIEIFVKRFPALSQIACFDTAFHDTMPNVAKLLPIPRKFYDQGIRRYGFHGLSYSYLLEKLFQTKGEAVARGRVIMAHLGNGASLAAVRDGQCLDTSMGFTPTGGLPMSTRTGELDPGVVWYLIKKENLDPQQLNDLLNHQSGLLGISGTSTDMRELIERQAYDQKAADAVEVFCYQIRKYIGAYAAVLGGIDTLIFSGGIGENSSEVRARICAGLSFLGIELDEQKNKNNEQLISASNANVEIHVIKTDEELMIARASADILRYTIEK